MQEATATLIVGDWRSVCARCQVGAFWSDTHHTRAAGGSREIPCGARFTAIRHADGRGYDDVLRAMRPDLPIVVR